MVNHIYRTFNDGVMVEMSMLDLSNAFESVSWTSWHIIVLEDYLSCTHTFQIEFNLLIELINLRINIMDINFGVP